MNLILKKDELNTLLTAWRQDYEVYAPQSLQKFTHFLPLQDGDPLVEAVERHLELSHLAVAQVVEVEHALDLGQREADPFAHQHQLQPGAVAA